MLARGWRRAVWWVYTPHPFLRTGSGSLISMFSLWNESDNSTWLPNVTSASVTDGYMCQVFIMGTQANVQPLLAKVIAVIPQSLWEYFLLCPPVSEWISVFFCSPSHQVWQLCQLQVEEIEAMDLSQRPSYNFYSVLSPSCPVVCLKLVLVLKKGGGWELPMIFLSDVFQKKLPPNNLIFNSSSAWLFYYYF